MSCNSISKVNNDVICRREPWRCEHHHSWYWRLWLSGKHDIPG